jgi:Na+-translocating ferredoxin:NAD+ oxidoreductase RnfG subunit
MLAGLALSTPLAHVAHAETYLSENQAAAILLPGVKLQGEWPELSKEQIRLIEKNSGERVRQTRPRVLWGPRREALFIDQVLGKHELITYAVALTPEGKVSGVEIMDYRETHGAQVREHAWLKQFTGKGAGAVLKVESDIRNISGATLSCVHVTNGIRRIVRTYEALKTKI